MNEFMTNPSKKISSKTLKYSVAFLRQAKFEFTIIMRADVKMRFFVSTKSQV